MTLSRRGFFGAFGVGALIPIPVLASEKHNFSRKIARVEWDDTEFEIYEVIMNYGGSGHITNINQGRSAEFLVPENLYIFQVRPFGYNINIPYRITWFDMKGNIENTCEINFSIHKG